MLFQQGKLLVPICSVVVLIEKSQKVLLIHDICSDTE